MKKIVAIIFIFVFMGIYCSTAVRKPGDNTGNINSDSIYNEIVSQIKNGSEDVDFTELRMVYANSSSYDPYGKDYDVKKSMRRAYDNGDYEGVVRYAKELIGDNFLDINSHVFCGMAYKKMGDKEKRDYHGFIALGLLNSIIGSGDGKTPETAFRVISVTEEYALLDMWGLKMSTQWLLEENGHEYDKLEAEDIDTGEKVTLYFNVDLPLRWSKRQVRQ